MSVISVCTLTRSIDAYEQTSTCAFDIIGIALVTLEMIYNTLLINALRFWFAIRELLDNLATGKHSMPVWSFTLRSLNCVFTILADSWSLKGITTTTGQRLLNVFYIISSVTSAMLVMPDTPVDMCSYASMDFSFLVRCFLPPCELSDSSQNESPSSQYGVACVTAASPRKNRRRDVDFFRGETADTG